jgi:1-deoxy-D-xylulose 5-phosphate reductoisomerase
MNAANEECVSSFIERKLSFLSIVEIVNKVLELHISSSHFVANSDLTIDKLFTADKQARVDTKRLISEVSK